MLQNAGLAAWPARLANQVVPAVLPPLPLRPVVSQILGQALGVPGMAESGSMLAEPGMSQLAGE